MTASKKHKLPKAGWKVGSAAELLGLNAEEQVLVAMKLDLVQGVRVLRERHRITQADLAKRFGSSQSRVAKAEAGDQFSAGRPKSVEARTSVPHQQSCAQRARCELEARLLAPV
ncbi:MAG TPA: helix-turn-helix domain-containing protein [Polyangiales bacterium]